jgi:hypothetical protein
MSNQTLIKCIETVLPVGEPGDYLDTKRQLLAHIEQLQRGADPDIKGIELLIFALQQQIRENTIKTIQNIKMQ